MSDGEEALTPLPSTLWQQNSVNGHWYKVIPFKTWADSEAAAVALGGHLATIRERAESDWLYDHFGGLRTSNNSLWIGFTDEVLEGVFQWTSGEPPTFVNWAPGEPANATGLEDYALLIGSHGPSPAQWAALNGNVLLPGIMEINFSPPPPSSTTPLFPDSDLDGVQDGTELGVTVGWPGNPGQGILGTDLGIFVPDADPLTTTDPLDDDSTMTGCLTGRRTRTSTGRSGRMSQIRTFPTLMATGCAMGWKAASGNPWPDPPTESSCQTPIQPRQRIPSLRIPMAAACPTVKRTSTSTGPTSHQPNSIPMTHSTTPSRLRCLLWCAASWSPWWRTECALRAAPSSSTLWLVRALT